MLVQLGVASGISLDYLRKQVAAGKLTKAGFEAAFADEIKDGLEGATLKVATNLFRCATAWPPIKGVTPTCMVFWLKNRAKWAEDTASASVKMTESKDPETQEKTVEFSIKIGDGAPKDAG
ncbi:hypothetical protein [uncultured Pleomorphomonas sp.]|uniref:hypothetical protein n=1 Tax=uncultured Pleomorphomonas sp. TaxID=442121 RepID=UPI0025894FD1|nr:hypothetical protein [uncultured Pleomorphomonas sp.]